MTASSLAGDFALPSLAWVHWGLHVEMPLLAFPDLVHLGVALLSRSFIELAAAIVVARYARAVCVPMSPP